MVILQPSGAVAQARANGQNLRVWRISMAGWNIPNSDSIMWQCVKTLVPLVNIKIAGKWMVIPLKIVLIGIDPYPSSFGIFPQVLACWKLSSVTQTQIE